MGERLAVRGAQLAEEHPEWLNALGPVPAKPAKAAEWRQVAAEVEAYRNQYNIPAHEIRLIPKTHRDDPAAAALIARATALHKHSALVKAPPQTPEQIQQTADELQVAERVRTTPAPAQEAIEKLRQARAASSDPLPVPQQRAAAITEAATTDAPQQPLSIKEAIAAAVARHRSQNQPAPFAPGVLKTELTETKETTVAEKTQSTSHLATGMSKMEREQADLVHQHKVARSAGQQTTRREDPVAGTRRADEVNRYDRRRSF